MTANPDNDQGFPPTEELTGGIAQATTVATLSGKAKQ